MGINLLFIIGHLLWLIAILLCLNSRFRIKIERFNTYTTNKSIKNYAFSVKIGFFNIKLTLFAYFNLSGFCLIKLSQPEYDFSFSAFPELK